LYAKVIAILCYIKYLSDSYKHRLLDKLQRLCQASMSAQDYTIEFDYLTLHCEVQEDSYQAISRYRSGLRSDIQWACSFTLIS